MSATRRDGDAARDREALARELRETVADQLHDLVVERESAGSQAEVTRQLGMVRTAMVEIVQAQGRQKQASELGLPLQPSRVQERDARHVLRQQVMMLGAACGAWAVALDFAERRPREIPE